MDFLKSEGINERLAFHISSLFIRDPIPTYDIEFKEESINDDEKSAHFENL